MRICIGAIALALPFVAAAESTPETRLLQQELEAKVPSTWQLHVTARDAQILAFVTPPYQEGFDLWYAPEKLRATLQGLCPDGADAIWQHLRPDQTIVIQPTVGGKSADGMRLDCPRGTKPGA